MTGWFTEGFETRDLKAAKALLEELGGQGVRGLGVMGLRDRRRNVQCRVCGHDDDQGVSC